MNTATEDNNIISIRDLHKSFGEQTVLQGITLELKKGENLVVLGKSGSGKSVLIKCIVGLIYPDSGEISVFGKNVAEVEYGELNEVRKRTGFLFQSAALYDSMTVRENLEFPLKKVKGMKEAGEIEGKVMEVLENVGLADAVDKMPSQLSGGMKKRIGLARTLIMDPEIMLYDEPTTGLDPITSNEISELITEVQEKYRTSSIIITHDMLCARKTANRVNIIREGKIYSTGSYEELSSSDDSWVQSFFY